MKKCRNAFVAFCFIGISFRLCFLYCDFSTLKNAPRHCGFVPEMIVNGNFEMLSMRLDKIQLSRSVDDVTLHWKGGHEIGIPNNAWVGVVLQQHIDSSFNGTIPFEVEAGIPFKITGTISNSETVDKVFFAKSDAMSGSISLNHNSIFYETGVVLHCEGGNYKTIGEFKFSTAEIN